jgi:hypothetical protein
MCPVRSVTYVSGRSLVAYIAPLLVPLLMPFMKFLSTPKRAARGVLLP